MHRPSRLISLSCGLLVASLVFVTSGFACDSGSQQSMTAMHMNGSGVDAQHNTDNSPPELPPCRFPWAPDGCQSMVPCAPVAVVSTAFRVALFADVEMSVHTSVGIAPPSERPAPELPPPRA
jgi:hypothetical protein